MQTQPFQIKLSFIRKQHSGKEKKDGRSGTKNIVYLFPIKQKVTLQK